jgi:hypothetical protein
MKARLNFTIEAPSLIAARLGEDTTVYDHGAAAVTRAYEVRGVNTTTAAKFTEEVEAASAEAAEADVATATKIVVLVREA